MTANLNETLSESFEGRDKLVEKYKTVDDLAKAAMEAVKLASSGPRVPSGDAPAEDWAAFYRKLGAPESPDGYQISADAPGAELLSPLREPAAQMGVTENQWSALSKALTEQLQAQGQAAQEAASERNQEWRKEVAQKLGPDFEDKLTLAQKAFGDLLDGDDELRQVFDETGLGNHPKMIDLMLKVNDAMSDGALPSDQGASPEIARENAKSLARRWREIQNSAEYKDERNPEWNALFNESLGIVAKLTEMGLEGPMDPRLEDGPKLPY